MASECTVFLGQGMLPSTHERCGRDEAMFFPEGTENESGLSLSANAPTGVAIKAANNRACKDFFISDIV